MLDRYLAARPELDREAFLADYRALAALNAARILGIFARQVAACGQRRSTRPSCRAPGATWSATWPTRRWPA